MRAITLKKTTAGQGDRKLVFLLLSLYPWAVLVVAVIAAALSMLSASDEHPFKSIMVLVMGPVQVVAKYLLLGLPDALPLALVWYGGSTLYLVLRLSFFHNRR